MNLGNYERMKVTGNRNGFPVLQDKDGETVLLDEQKSLKQVDIVEVFLYDDHEIVATFDKPKLTLGEVGLLSCVSVTGIGAFLDWGLKKDLFLPFSEQIGQVNQGRSYFVGVYIDKSNRLCASMEVQRFLKGTDRFKENDEVRGVVYNVVPEIGAFVAVERKYQGLIRNEDYRGILSPGDRVQARVKHVKDDGRLDLSFRERAYKQLDRDAQLVYDTLISEDGFLPTNDKTDPKIIRDIYGISKSAYKRACGRLLKMRKIEFYRNGIRLKR